MDPGTISAPCERRRQTRTPRSEDVLAQIAGRRRSDLREELAGTSLATLTDAAASAAPSRDLLHRLSAPGLHLIAEVKRRSPSAGELPGGAVDITTRAQAYEAGGAAAISVLTEPHWFGGSLDDLRAVRAAVSLPILAKDFVVDPRQLPLLREAGADLVLLLAALHPTRRLQALVEQAREVGLEPLVEVHAAHDLAKALSTPARLIGLNSRDLRTLRIHAHQAARLRQRVPDDRLVVAESGLGSPAELVTLRSLGFDAALVGSALMSAGARPDRIRQRTAAFVAAGRSPDATDPAAAARRPSVKICGITDAAGIAAAVSAGADAIGLNFVSGTPRALGMDKALDLVRLARSLSVDGRSPRIVGIFADADPSLVEQTARALGLDGVQLSGNESLASVARISRPIVKVLHLPGQADPDEDIEPEVTALLERARAYLALPSVSGLLLDRAHPAVRGGTGLSADPRFVARIAAQLPVGLAGGLDAANVAAAVLGASVIGVDVSSGVEEQAVPGVGRGPRKDPLLVRLFTKRARAARLDRPHAPAFPAAADPGLLDADAAGRWGLDREFGGRFVPETLVAPLLELERAYAELRHDGPFWAELRQLAARYVGRPTPLYRADRLAAMMETVTGRPSGSLALYLKREDLAHTGAHKINNALGQVLLAQRLGRSRIIAETGAGQHGVATATACALLGLPCVVYMGEEDVRRQHPNVLRMRVLGAEVRPVTSGNGTLKDAVNEAIRDWVANARTTHYVLGSAVGPHPYPAVVRDFQRVIGDEAAAQILEMEGRLPDAAVACLGGGSNAIGLFARFIGEPEVRLVGIEAAGRGMHTGQHAAALAGGRPGILHGSRSYLMQDSDGQVLEPHSISAGLDYPGIGPQLSALYEASQMEVLGATDEEALAALRLVARTEGILPALEPAHAIAALPGLLATHAPRPLPVPALVLVGLSGRGDKDMAALDPA